MPPLPEIHNDEPDFDSSLDRFAQRDLVASIAETIAFRATPPMVASLNGDWGQGKTSLLREIHRTLTRSLPGATLGSPPSKFKNVRVIWFEAWRYQHDPTPIVALLNEIRRQLEKLSFTHALVSKTKKLAPIAVESALLSLDDLGGRIAPFASAGGLVKNIQKVGNEWEQRHHAYALPSETIRRLLDNAISDLLKNLEATGKHRRLIVIIDDLDRCQPIVAYKLLEGLKIFLNLPSCAFLIGINRKEVERAIRVGLSAESGYEKGSLPENMPREYYEKLCSHSWDIPFPTPRQTSDYLIDLLHRSLGLERLAVVEEFKKQLDNTSLAHLRLLPANPRRIKAYANNLAIFCRSTADADAPADAPLLLVLAYIATFLPELNRHLLANPRCLFDLRARSIAIYAPAPTGNPDAVEAPRENIHANDPFNDIIPNPDVLRYAAPEDPAIFRLAPLLARMGTITEPQVHRYLPYAAL